jgi:hypothetical protein
LVLGSGGGDSVLLGLTGDGADSSGGDGCREGGVGLGGGKGDGGREEDSSGGKVHCDGRWMDGGKAG